MENALGKLSLVESGSTESWMPVGLPLCTAGLACTDHSDVHFAISAHPLELLEKYGMVQCGGENYMERAGSGRDKSLANHHTNHSRLPEEQCVALPHENNQHWRRVAVALTSEPLMTMQALKKAIVS